MVLFILDRLIVGILYWMFGVMYGCGMLGGWSWGGGRIRFRICGFGGLFLGFVLISGHLSLAYVFIYIYTIYNYIQLILIFQNKNNIIHPHLSSHILYKYIPILCLPPKHPIPHPPNNRHKLILKNRHNNNTQKIRHKNITNKIQHNRIQTILYTILTWICWITYYHWW